MELINVGENCREHLTCAKHHRGLPWSLIQSSEHVHDVDIIIHFRCEENGAQNLPPEVTGSQLNSAAQVCI